MIKLFLSSIKIPQLLVTSAAKGKCDKTIFVSLAHKMVWVLLSLALCHSYNVIKQLLFSKLNRVTSKI